MDKKEKIRLKIEREGEIPPLPQVAIQALNIVMNSEVDIEKLAKIIESDPALSVKILNLVNRASIGVSEIKSISHAIAMLGLNIVRYALLGVIIEGITQKEDERLLEIQKSLWAHSLCCAILSSLIAEKTYPELKAKAFICGLLHDIGKAGLIICCPDDYLDLMNKISISDDSILMEENIFSTNHCIVGHWMAKKWQFPEEIKEIISYHHCSSDMISDLTKTLELIKIVKLANILAHMFLLEFVYDPNNEYDYLLIELKFNDLDIENILKKLKKEYEEKSKFFDLHKDITEFYSEIIDKTRRRLATISVELELQNKKLKKLYIFQSILLNFATGLINIKSFNNIFSSLNKIFQEINRYKMGAIYILNLKNKLLNASFYQKGKSPINIATFLDNKGNPIWRKDIKFSEYIKKFLSVVTAQVHKKISKEILKNGIILNPPFVFLPFHLSKFGITGELCLVMEKEPYKMDEDEKNFWLQITGIIQQSLEKIEAIKQLETKTEELTMALYKNQKFQEKLIETERLASLGQLAAGIAHEINNPLAIISGRVQMLMFSESDEKKMEQLRQILEQIDRISSLLERVMDFARIRKPEFSMVDLKLLLDKLIDFIQPGLKKRGISIIKNYASDIPPIKGDFSQLEQVFLNLLINAKQALEKKSKDPKVEVRIELDRSKEFVIVRIIDNGCGIPKHIINRVFEPFFTTKEPGKGTGLGLSTSYSIIKQHHGKITIKSEENKFTEVSVYLPIDMDKFISEREPEKTPQIHQDLSVLVVDDEEYIRGILKEILVKEGIKVIECANGEEALTQIETKRIDLVLLDIKMPVMNGLDFVKSFKKRGYKIPIIIVTGWAEDEEVKELLKEEGYFCIKKPFHIKDVLKAVYKALTKEK